MYERIRGWLLYPRLKFCTILFWQPVHHQFITVVDEFLEKRKGHRTICGHGIPMFFVHVVAGRYAIVAFAQIDRSFGIAFEIYTTEIIDAAQRKGLAHHLVHQGIGPKRCFFGDSRFRQYVGSKDLNVHVVKIGKITDIVFYGYHCAQSYICTMKNELVLPEPNTFATREEFAMGAFLLIDKPLGWTSFDVLNRIKAYVRNNMPPLPPNEHGHDQRFKIGHAGTLDPLASGLLTVCTGKYTKLIDDIQSGEKVYTGTIVLGCTTPSYDLETEPENPKSTEHVTPEDIERVRASFVGETWQRPPLYSAKQVDGKRAYQAARKGQDMIIPAVPIMVNSFEIKLVSPGKIDFEINCAKGTYIRSIAHDFGQKLGTGAYLAALRRVSSHPFHVSQSIDLEVLLARLEAMP